MDIPSSSLKLTNPKASTSAAAQGALHAGNLYSLKIINTDTQKSLLLCDNSLPFPTDLVAVLTVEWHLEAVEEGTVSAAPQVTIWVGQWCYRSSGFWPQSRRWGDFSCAICGCPDPGNLGSCPNTCANLRNQFNDLQGGADRMLLTLSGPLISLMGGKP